MSSVKWTENQQNAITAQGGSVLVSAAAGSGKTAVLVQRIIDTITHKENPVSIDRMLIVTFTRAASQEMRTRIDEALNKLLKEDPYNSYLIRQKQLLYNARISTIDGFCTDFVRQYFYKLNIQKDFRIADEKELVLLRNKALDNTLDFFYNENSQDFIQLVNSVCTYRDDKNLRENILNIYRFLVTIPFMDSWIEKAVNIYNVEKTPVSTSPYIKNILNNIKESMSFSKSLIENAKTLIEKDTYLNEKHLDKFRQMFIADTKIVDTIYKYADQGDWDSIYNSDFSFSRFPTIKNSSEDTIKETVSEIRKTYKSEINKAYDLVYRDIQDIENETIKLYPIIKALFNCVKKYHQEFSALKRDKNIADFSDIENFMIQLLCKETENKVEYTHTAKEISSMFDCIMVDEFQDINEVQNLLFKALSKDESNLFMVGDVKQSIYGFRQAKPEIFIDYKNKYNLYSKDDENYPAKIILDKNFRSRKGVLDACNFVFENIMSKDVGGIVYNDEEKLFCGAEYPKTDTPQMEVNLIDISDIDRENNETKDIIEAQQTGFRILYMLYKEKTTVTVKGETRPANFGDVAILLRTAKGEGKKAITFVNCLNSMGIPAVASEKNSFFDIFEIKIMLNLLRVVDNPIQDIPVLSVLMSPMFGFTADDMARIRAEYRNIPIYNGVLKDSKVNKKSADFIYFISKLRKISVTTTVDRLIGIILQLTSFDSVVMAINNNPAQNLSMLQEYARTFGANGYKNLSSFVSFIDKIQERGLDLDAGESSDNIDANVVKVMSIHSSKGLEFPICFICGTGTGFNTKDTSKDLVLESENGVGIRYKEDYLKFDTIQRKSAALTLNNTFISEEMRILYVAMTRAKERLIITTAQAKPYDYLVSVSNKITGNKITPYAVKNCKSMSDWIVACSLLHPSCEDLRNSINCQIDTKEDNTLTPWSFNIITRNSETEDIEIMGGETVDYNSVEEINNQEQTAEILSEDVEFIDQVKAKINFKYINQALTTLPQKVSASDLAHRDNDVFSKVLRTPEFITEKSTKGTDRGTAFHSFMEHCDFAKARKDVVSEAKNLVSRGFLTEQQLELLDTEKISDFLSTKLFTRIINSKEYFREYKFTVKINGEEYDSNIDNSVKEQKIIMQGAVDLAFVEDNQLVIVDYKTDRVKDINILEHMYSKQLDLYKSAMEQCTELKVKEMYIYSFNLNETLKL